MSIISCAGLYENCSVGVIVVGGEISMHTLKPYTRLAVERKAY
jgi:hypothetical protein